MATGPERSALRALAHPLRSRILAELRVHGDATATDLAQALDTHTGATSYHLRRLGVEHVVLDADERPGGAWQHRWDSLTMDDVHGVADLPDAPAPGRGDEPANQVIASWFDEYEQAQELPLTTVLARCRAKALRHLEHQDCA